MQGQTLQRVWIADRNPIYRRGLRTSLEATDSITVVSETASLAPVPEGPVDVLLFEASSKQLAAATAAGRALGCKSIAIAETPNEDLLFELVQSGVSAVHLRAHLDPATLLRTVLTVGDDHALLPAEMVPVLLARAAASGGPNHGGLSERELSVLELLADGADTRNIATELAYSERTVKNIVHDVLMKLNCRNRAHAVATATRQGLI